MALNSNLFIMDILAWDVESSVQRVRESPKSESAVNEPNNMVWTENLMLCMRTLDVKQYLQTKRNRTKTTRSSSSNSQQQPTVFRPENANIKLGNTFENLTQRHNYIFMFAVNVCINTVRVLECTFTGCSVYVQQNEHTNSSE